MLGMIFGVAAVVAMLSIGAGAQQQVMAFIEQLGVRNLIVEAREAADQQSLQKVRKRLGRADLPGLCGRFRRTSTASPRRPRASGSRRPSCCRKPQGDMPTVYGVSAAYQPIARLRRHARAVLQRGEDRRRGAGGRPRTGGDRGAVRRRRSDRPVRQGQPAVVSGDRHRRARSSPRRPTSPDCRRRTATT